MAENFNETAAALFKGMDSFISAKTVVGDAVKFDDGTIIVPLVDVSFAVGAGAFAKDSKNSAGGGMGGKITANSVLVIRKPDGKELLPRLYGPRCWNSCSPLTQYRNWWVSWKPLWMKPAPPWKPSNRTAAMTACRK